jgi:hypothetical protein
VYIIFANHYNKYLFAIFIVAEQDDRSCIILIRESESASVPCPAQFNKNDLILMRLQLQQGK